MRYSILIPDRSRPPADVEAAVFGEDVDFVLLQAKSAKEVPDDAWKRADAILLWHDVVVDSSVLACLDRCRVIVRIGVGIDNVDLAAAGSRGITVCNVPDYGVDDVADHALAMILALERGLFGYDAAARDGIWEWDAVPDLRRITDQTLGVIGFGRIGTATARRAQALGMEVAFFDPYKEDGYDKALGVGRFDQLPELLASSDVVTLHVPLTDETRSMVGRDFLTRLRPGSLLVNTSRGPVVDLDALSDGLRSGRLRGAGLDVLPSEPPDREHPLIKAWMAQETWVRGRLVITPHCAFHNQESLREMRRKAALEARRVLDGEPPRNCVNRQFLIQQHDD